MLCSNLPLATHLAMWMTLLVLPATSSAQDVEQQRPRFGVPGTFGSLDEALPRTLPPTTEFEVVAEIPFAQRRLAK